MFGNIKKTDDNMFRSSVLLALLSVFFISPALGQKVIYVAPNGSNQHTGSLQRPIATMRQALLLAKKAPRGKIDIVLRAGVYYPDTTIVIRSKDFQHKTIRIKAFNTEKVVISGAHKVNLKWYKHSPHIYAAKLALGFVTDAMYINGKPCVMARYPNYDASARVFNGTAPDAISTARVKGWSNPEGGFLHALHSGEWGSFHYRFTGKNMDGTLTMQGGWQNNRPSPLHAQFRFVENIFEELDAPGEWYYHKAHQTLYYYPTSEGLIDSGAIEFSKLKTILHLVGNAST
ncbi:MAG: peptide-binding protein, partial [Bacteroidetes bacterium]